jgi:hypothetical protein
MPDEHFFVLAFPFGKRKKMQADKHGVVISAFFQENMTIWTY